MVRTPPANGLTKKAAWYVDRRFLVVSAPFLLDKQNRQLRRTTRSVIRLQFAHPNRLGTSQVTADTNLLSLVSVVCTRRGLGNFDSPRKNETEELKFCIANLVIVRKS